ncbi:MAG: molecular chaperone DjiA [Paludibacteraceae bacterium]|nr:molecular chaperone DjiA [Paludibacteraceae bacterium]
MGIFKTILFGGLGFTLGGPIGMIVGVVIAALSDVGKTDFGKAIDDGSSFGGKTRHFTRQQTANDFKVALLVMFAAVMKADGQVVKSELTVVKRFLLKNYGEEGTLEALKILKALLNTSIDVDAVSKQCAENMSYSTRLHLLHLLYSIADADGKIDPSEKAVINRIAVGMEVTMADIQSIAAMFHSSQGDNSWAYSVLELEQGASQDEIKKAYRRMAMKYHPDKVSTLGDEAKTQATERFRKVKEAYELLMGNK